MRPRNRRPPSSSAPGSHLLVMMMMMMMVVVMMVMVVIMMVVVHRRSCDHRRWGRRGRSHRSGFLRSSNPRGHQACADQQRREHLVHPHLLPISFRGRRRMRMVAQGMARIACDTKLSFLRARSVAMHAQASSPCLTQKNHRPSQAGDSGERQRKAFAGRCPAHLTAGCRQTKTGSSGWCPGR